ncbi:unnamed protein product [Darwinula stevensoni]|uniref:Carboxypeptidase activation peptide domain-containing protein n=1 Tax=Darwinula stevensoni TaxID=69355 RepID=A0A7R9FRU2_9CRUS|nr:unnamed protein product [Darwinula stevensoni]CAG0901645.1 unnamed protein product [Darwinula stevensoni]
MTKRLRQFFITGYRNFRESGRAGGIESALTRSKEVPIPETPEDEVPMLYAEEYSDYGEEMEDQPSCRKISCRKAFLFLGFLIVGFCHQTEERRFHNHSVVRVVPHDLASLDAIRKFRLSHSELDFWREPSKVDSPVDFMVGPEDQGDILSELRRDGFHAQVIIPDVQRSSVFS